MSIAKSSKKIGFKLSPITDNIVEVKSTVKPKKSKSKKKKSYNTIRIYLVDNDIIDRLNEIEVQIINDIQESTKKDIFKKSLKAVGKVLLAK